MQKMAVLQRRMLSFPRDNMTDKAQLTFSLVHYFYTLKIIKVSTCTLL